MSKIVLLSNHHGYTYNFRKEIIQAFLDKNHEVHLVLPYGEKVDNLVEMGCTFTDVDLDRHGTNVFSEASLLRKYYKIIKKQKPDYIMSYTIKPNIYGGIISKYLNIPIIPNITGLGSAVENTGILQKLTLMLYKFSFKNVKTAFFQNKANRQFFIDNMIAVDKHKMLPGSGINIKKFNVLEYPNDTSIDLVFMSRVMKEKGIDHFLEAAEYLTKKYSNLRFHVCGFCEEKYEEILQKYQNRGIIIYHGMVNNVQEIYENSDAVVLPSYHEGMSNVLLEAAACGRPVIASDIPGCKETFEDGITGFSFPKQDTEGLIQAIEKFIQLDNNTRKQMGLSGRQKMEKEFDRQIVVEKYLKEIESI